MMPLTPEWLEKAENDYICACREMELGSKRSNDLACFLCQQFAEKYLKAYLQDHSKYFHRTHELSELFKLSEISDFDDEFLESLMVLSTYSFLFRYPGHSASDKECEFAFRTASEVRNLVRETLGITSSDAD